MPKGLRLVVIAILLAISAPYVARGESMTTDISLLPKPPFAVSSDLTRLAVSKPDGIRVFDLATGRLLSHLEGALPGTQVEPLVFGSDGRALLGVQCRADPDSCWIQDMPVRGKPLVRAKIARSSNVNWLRTASDGKIVVMAFNDEILAWTRTAKGFRTSGRADRAGGYGGIVVVDDNIVTVEDDGLRFLEVGPRGLRDKGHEPLDVRRIGAQGDLLWIVAGGQKRLILRRKSGSSFQTLGELRGDVLWDVAVSADGGTLLFKTSEAGTRMIRACSLPDLAPLRTFQVNGLPDVFDYFGSTDGRSVVIGTNGARAFTVLRIDETGEVRTQSVAY